MADEHQVVCEICAYWERTTAQKGLCRKCAPLPVAPDPEEDMHWPVTKPDDYCWEFVRVREDGGDE